MNPSPADDDRTILDEQIAYYRARAAEYDQWFFREGRYDRGDEHRKRWSAEIGEVEAALREIRPAGDILEVACGTGLWTRHLVHGASHVTAIDASPEALLINQGRVSSPKVEYVQADLFRWTPQQAYDFVFFGFWLSHVPPERFEQFWRSIGAALKPGGRAFFVDSAHTQESTAADHAPVTGSGVAERKLNNGRRYRVVKVFYHPQTLEQTLHRLGWCGYVRTTGEFFIYGCLSRQ